MDVNTEKCAEFIKDTVSKIELIEGVSTMPAHEKVTEIKALYVCLDIWLDQFCTKIDNDRRSARTQREEAYINALFLKTLELVDVERMPGRRALAA